MNRINSLQVITFLLFLFLAISTTYLLYDYKGYVELLSSKISVDGHIENPTEMIINIKVLLAITIFGWMSLTSSYNINSFLNLERLYKFSLIVVILLFIAFPLAKTKYVFLIHAEDGLLETITAISALLASIILFFSIDHHKGRVDVLVKVFLSGLFFVFGMEEISWGQRLFGWDASHEVFKENVQNETNFHNYFNTYFQVFYPLFNLTLCLSLIFFIKLRKISLIALSFLNLEKYFYLFPSKEFELYIQVFFILSVHSAFFGGELTEEIFAIFILTYAIHQLLLSKQRKCM